MLKKNSDANFECVKNGITTIGTYVARAKYDMAQQTLKKVQVCYTVKLFHSIDFQTQPDSAKRFENFI